MSRDADEHLTEEQVAWADIIFVMERAHRRKLQTNYRLALKDKQVVVLGIPDEYGFMDPPLVALLHSKMRRWLPR
ncbi:hypothetical protein [Erythrobacter sp.]|uniref:hypothetical protein n=1 Tax=Erythrobacter sp. TaxID=1042 RepID=UPI0025E40FF4|nr:hypothetical protein [Erythrobacter sp.]